MRDPGKGDPFLQASTIVDYDRPEVFALAQRLAGDRTNDTGVARACFEWVRDEVRHTVDHQLDVITCSASEVLQARTGFCYAKSHLLTALLRANGLRSGFVYQRLALDANASTFGLHGLNAVWLKEYGWYRLDPRGSRAGLSAEFDPPREVLPFACLVPGERLFPSVCAEPLQVVVDALKHCRHRTELERRLPDATDLSPFTLRPTGAVDVLTR